MKFKNKIIKGLAMSMAFSMLFTTNAFATPIDLANSEMDVKTDTLDKNTGTDYFTDEENEWLDGTINEEVRVIVDLESQFEITIPKEIVLDGGTGKADYIVNAKGDIAGDQVLKVEPEPDFILKENGGKDNQTAVVTQQDIEYTYQELLGNGTDYDGSITANLTAGEWNGKFYFNIEFKNKNTNSSLFILKYTKVDEQNEITENFDTVEKIKEVSSNNSNIKTAKLILNSENNNDKQDLSEMFINDENLIEVDLTDVNSNNVSSIDNMFENSPNLKKVIITQELNDAFNNISEKAGIDENIIEIINNSASLPEKYGYLNNYSWDEIAMISEAGKADEYFNIGDEKTITIGSEEYTVQIYDFNHDDLTDGSGKAGITFGLKEVMTTGYNMNPASDGNPYGTNRGGWRDTDMRNYINKNIYNLLPLEVRKVIKKVDKISDVGSYDTSTRVTVSDNLFLLSLEEVEGTHINYMEGQGYKYEFFNNNILDKRGLDGLAAEWWLRSSSRSSNYKFWSVDNLGSTGIPPNASARLGISFAFCI